MEPLKKVQVEGYVMFAEPEVLFGNLDELCCVSCFQKINPDLSDNLSCAGYLCFLQGVCQPSHQACNTGGRFTCNKDPRCKKLQHTDLLVAPVHHIMKVGSNNL